MLNNWVHFQFSIMKKLWNLAQENLVIKKGSYLFMDVSQTLDIAIYE